VFNTMFRNDISLVLIGLSGWCLLVLLGVLAYSGHFYPSVALSSVSDVIKWVVFLILVIIPIITVCDLIVRYTRHRRKRR
jgi:hypothetical protein